MSDISNFSKDGFILKKNLFSEEEIMKLKNLINSKKDASRTKVIEIFPYISPQLSKKKDSNKADAILIASFFYETYQFEE